MKTFIKQYFWFWKESFSFMKGYNMIYIIWGCLKQAHKFALDMARWEKLSLSERANWYINAERTIETEDNINE
jgi:predicted RNA-binding protein with PIN domain